MDEIAGAGAACLTRARGLIPLLREAADRIETATELPADVLDAMFDAGMFKLLLYGGFELAPLDYIQCVEAIAEGDASAAWCMNQGSGCSMGSAYVAPAVAREIWGGPRDVVAWGQGPGANAVRTEGGWLVSGTWSFASGSRHATLPGALCPCLAADGTPIVRPDGKAWERTFMFRREAARIDDVWQVGRCARVDSGIRAGAAATWALVCAPGDAVVRQRLRQCGAGSFSGCVRRAGADQEPGLVGGFAARQPGSAAHRQLFRCSVEGGAGGAAQGGRRGLTGRRADGSAVTGAPDGDQAGGDLRDSCLAGRGACSVPRGGAAAIFTNHPFERRLRDVNSVSQQLHPRRTHFETVGLYRLGGEPNLRWI
jgi:hypothetical protein